MEQTKICEVKKKPSIKIYARDDKGGIIKESEIALWSQTSKTGKPFYSGKDLKGKTFVAFPN